MQVEITSPGVKYTYGLPVVLTVEEAAEFLRLNVKTLYAAIDMGTVPARKFGKRIVILRDALLDWMRSKARGSSRNRRS